MEQVEKEFKWFLDPVREHYFDFEGRVTRQAFWMFTLWYFIINVALSIVSDAVAGLFSLAVLLPSIAIGARRLHDIGMSGWWQLIGLIPIVGWIALMVLLAKQGIAGPNEYGTDPRAAAPVSPMPAAPAASPTPFTPSIEAAPTDTEVK